MLKEVQLGIDFTKLAKLACHQDRYDLGSYFISKEKALQKKIPYYLQNEYFDIALKEAIKCGDPNNINKVFSEIF